MAKTSYCKMNQDKPFRLFATSRRLRKQRQGMTLILVISIIVLFLLMGTSFVVMSQNYLSASRSRVTQLKVRGDSGRDLVQRAFYDLFRGVDLENQTSPLRGQSILADQYGYGMTATVMGTPTSTTGGMIQLQLDNTALILDGGAVALQPVTGYYDGLILSFVSGEAKGLSCRIISYVVDDMDNAYFFIARNWSDGTSPFNSLASLAGDRVVVNGRPFFGKGAGGLNGAAGIGQPAIMNDALQPNQVGELSADVQDYLESGVHESWDAIDYQNMFLAADAEYMAGRPFASFDREQLYDYAGMNPPLDQDRTNFRAFGDPGDDLQVDTDGDGINDAIWMDIGLPVQTDINGRRYKPLVAYRVVDLDSRLNVNAHGNGYDSQLDRTNQTTFDNSRDADSSPYPLLAGAESYLMPIGQGYGPPEISLQPIFNTEYENILYGANVAGVDWPGRYTGSGDAIPGGNPGENLVPAGEQLVFNRQIGYPDSVVGNIFGNPMDMFGRFTYAYYDEGGALPIGLPFIDADSTLASNTERIDTPYEVDFSRSNYRGGMELTQPDQLYTPRELERVLRWYDQDVKMLPQRLAELGATTFASDDNRKAVTTEQWELPTPPAHLVPRLFNLLDASLTNVQKRQLVNLLLPPDIIRGLKMDINRPFGNGWDNNGNNHIDDYYLPGLTFAGSEETATAESYSSVDGNIVGEPTAMPVNMDLDNNLVAGEPSEGYWARYNFARELYMVILLTTQPGGNDLGEWFDYNGDLTTDQDDLFDYRREAAQWVINIVDFRDPDVIHTPFEFDLNPYNGWDVDGDLNAPHEAFLGPNERVVVWGIERPELILSETSAFHDRRTEDRDEDGDDLAGGDTDFDSRLVPVTGAFIEFYNPWVNQTQPSEIYNGGTGVDLTQRSRGAAGSPVWRVAIVNGEEPYDPLNLNDDRNRVANAPDITTGLTESDIERVVYFVDPGADAPLAKIAYFPNIVPNVVEPGQYGVIGPTGNILGLAGRYETTFGRLRTGTEPVTVADINATQAVVLNTVGNQVEVRRWDELSSSFVTDVRSNVVAVPIGQSRSAPAVPASNRSLSVSDPAVAGYPLVGPDGVTPRSQTVGDGANYTNATLGPDAYDEPVDKQGRIVGDPKSEYQYDVVRRTGTTATFCMVHLQRLANPLADYHPDLNPYITYDSMGMDLTAMNGVHTGPLDPADDDDDTDVDGNNMDANGERVYEKFESIERGDDENPSNPADVRRVLWPYQMPREQNDITMQAPFVSAPLHIFDYPYVSTLGTLNEPFNNPIDTTQMVYPPVRISPFFEETPYPWLAFNDRPYTSQFELANVPCWSNAHVFKSYSIFFGNPYTNAKQGYLHLPNLYHATNGTTKSSFDLYWILDYLETPSRFKGTDQYLDPTTMQGSAIHANAGYHFNPPFNTISNYRVPGKVNINLVFNEDVWDGVMGSVYSTAFPYSQMDNSRRSAAPGSAPGPFPTEFPNPFRPAEAANHMPTNGLVPDLAVDATLFRRRTTTQSLFDLDASNPLHTPLIGPHNHPTRSSYFKQAPRQKLANLVTTRSSVFAIWITVGFFEVDQDDELIDIGDEGVEVGSDDGSIRRYRGFYMVDRSIPVAFEPGNNHNVDKAVLIESITDQ